MRNFLTALFLSSGFLLSAQDPMIQSIIDAVNIDSMMHYVEELSGEVPVDLGDGPVTIVSRHKNNAGNALAQTYLEQKLTQFGYTPQAQSFSTTGRNVLATKTGVLYPDQFMILCAHYDAMPGGLFAAPAADDDGSGCGALLEAARILRDIPFEYSIIFAFWDEEEQGLVGSAYYANQMAANDGLIKGALNMDAIAYDGNGDTKARVHSRPIANSPAMADTVLAVLDRYGIDIDLLLTTPGATYSDHASFWNAGYSAILMIEEFGADGNPQYHTPNDRVQFFDVPYYEKMARLSIASFSTLAIPFNTTAIIEHATRVDPAAFFAYPNPTEGDATVWLEIPQGAQASVSLVNALGQELALLYKGQLTNGKHAFTVPLADRSPGTYTVIARVTGQPALSARLIRTP